MPTTLMIALAATFSAVVLGGTVALSAGLERRRVSRTLRVLSSGELRPQDLRDRTLSLSVTERILQPLGRRALGVVRALTPVAQLERFDRKLSEAGRPDGWDPSRLAAIRIVGRVVAPLGVYGLLSAIGTGRTTTILAAVAAGLALHLGPDALLDSMIRQRQQEIQRHLPDMADLLTITVEAGLGFDAALERVAKGTDGALGDELRRVVQDVHLGRARADALRRFADRAALPEVRSLVSSIVQAEQFGLTVGGVLRAQAAELRERRRQRAEEHAQKIPVKILVPLVFMILPATMVVMVGPGILEIIEQLGGG